MIPHSYDSTSQSDITDATEKDSRVRCSAWNARTIPPLGVAGEKGCLSAVLVALYFQLSYAVC